MGFFRQKTFYRIGTLLVCTLGLIYFLRKAAFDINFAKHKMIKTYSKQIEWPPNSEVDDKFVPSSDVVDFKKGTVIRGYVTWNNLIHYIRNQILGPSLRTLAIRTNKTHFSQAGQSEFVDQLLQGRKNGFYVECGAADEISLSNTLFFERTRNWTGLLIEANPTFFVSLMNSSRKAYLLNACLSPSLEPKKMSFLPADLLGGIPDYIDSHKARVDGMMKEKNEVNVQCFSLNHIMEAMGRNHIDYFSLDVEGAELSILKTIDWNKLKIDVLDVEYNGSKEKLTKMKQLLTGTGLYEFIEDDKVKGTKFKGMDAFFLRKNTTGRLDLYLGSF